jgi:hypothetical protein
MQSIGSATHILTGLWFLLYERRVGWTTIFLNHPVAFIQVQGTEPPVASFVVGGENRWGTFSSKILHSTIVIQRKQILYFRVDSYEWLERMPLHYTQAFVNRRQITAFLYIVLLVSRGRNLHTLYPSQVLFRYCQKPPAIHTTITCCFKGTTSRDKIKIFRQKGIFLCPNKSLYCFF